MSAHRDGARRIGPLKLALLGLLGFGVTLALIFLPAGRLDWVAGWVYFGLLLGGWAAMMIALKLKDPELIAHRTRAGEGTKGWDRLMLGLMRLATYGAVIVAGLDAGRYGWSTMPSWALPLGVALYVAGFALLIWAMTSNTHFEGTVRIQKDRDHKVIDGGPYRFVRHPGYVGFALAVGVTPLLLGSLWSAPLALAAVLTIVIRTALEDRTLRRELEGYEAYARRVRARLVPGVW